MYTITPPDPLAEEQIAALPTEAVRYLAEVFALLETAPWTGRPANPASPDGNMRIISFGEGGLVTYLVLEPQREIYILRVQWV
ncbi:hypothetical protein ACWDTT_23170 [Streptosporangium sandarakinum]|uniref:hypothetical protein n=1 Tax=Streptosporangium sandarakinum TaxID=1260955 RepID=UPI0036C02342